MVNQLFSFRLFQPQVSAYPTPRIASSVAPRQICRIKDTYESSCILAYMSVKMLANVQSRKIFRNWKQPRKLIDHDDNCWTLFREGRRGFRSILSQNTGIAWMGGGVWPMPGFFWRICPHALRALKGDHSSPKSGNYPTKVFLFPPE